MGIQEPANGKSEPEGEELYEELQDLIDEIPSNEPVVVLGNCNDRTDGTVIAEVKQRFINI